MKKNVFVLSALCVALISLSDSQDAFAFRKFLDQFSDHYDANNIPTMNLTDETSCGMCHLRQGGGGRRNPYGEDFKNISLGEDKGFPGIEFIDSDSDNFLNLEEIFAQTHPGQADNSPKGRIELGLKNENTLTVGFEGSCSELELMAFGFKLENNSGSLKLSNVSSFAEIKVSGTQGAILAKCAGEGFVGSLLR